jgi:hypothetical protein
LIGICLNILGVMRVIELNWIQSKLILETCNFYLCM